MSNIFLVFASFVMSHSQKFNNSMLHRTLFSLLRLMICVFTMRNQITTLIHYCPRTGTFSRRRWNTLWWLKWTQCLCSAVDASILYWDLFHIFILIGSSLPRINHNMPPYDDNEKRMLRNRSMHSQHNQIMLSSIEKVSNTKKTS